MTVNPAVSAHLTADDLITDRALTLNDPDQLEHAPIAGRVAELIASSEPPVNIALFGPWGSGKSSFAQSLNRELPNQLVATRLVTYDAWTFAGESFQRNFISQAATKLDFMPDTDEGRPFHSGLYQNKRNAHVNITPAQLWRASGTFVIVMAIGLALLAAASFVLFLISGAADPAAQVVGTIPSWITATGILALVGAFTKEVLDGARVEIEQSAPTQEQFRDTFCDLVLAAKMKHEVTHLVFFIDELDRCSAEQVVQVLSAVRHFLDQESCVFIVAADRQVVERALNTLPQATPVNIETPYYSSASEFIDKVFQHQLALPPLRTSSLNRFARDLVKDKERGLWHEVQGSDGGDRLRDELLYLLVPSHVRSPRRVKVLLNNFATSARIAQSRGLDWLDRATEIAKLTALQTEFPLFAADLHREPRLPSLLLADTSSPTLSPLTKALLERHALPNEAGEPPEGEPQPTDNPLVQGPDRTEISNSQRRQLRQYLQRTRGYRNPGSDLLYLEDTGKAVDLLHPAFGELMQAAPEDPTAAIAGARDEAPVEQQKAIRLLAGMVADTVGRERANVMTALLGVADMLEFEIGPYERDAIGALRTHSAEEGLDAEHLPLALRIAVGADDMDLTNGLLGDSRLWATPTQVGQVAGIADQLSEDQRDDVFVRVAESYATGSEPLTVPIQRLSEPVAEDLLDNTAVRDSLEARLASAPTSEDAIALGDELLSAANSRADKSQIVLGSVMYDLVGAGTVGYAVALARIDELDKLDGQPGLRNLVAIEAMQEAGQVNDLPSWSKHLNRTDDDRYDPNARTVLDTLVRVFADWAPGASLSSVIPTLVDMKASPDPGEAVAALTPSITAAIGSAVWWTAAGADNQREMHSAALALRSLGASVHEMASGLVTTDLKRALAAPPKVGQTEFTLAALSAAAPGLSGEDLRSLAEALSELSAPDPLDLLVTGCRVALATEAKRSRQDPQVPPFHVDAEDIVRLRGANGWGPPTGGWLELRPVGCRRSDGRSWHGHRECRGRMARAVWRMG